MEQKHRTSSDNLILQRNSSGVSWTLAFVWENEGGLAALTAALTWWPFWCCFCFTHGKTGYSECPVQVFEVSAIDENSLLLKEGALCIFQSTSSVLMRALCCLTHWPLSSPLTSPLEGRHCYPGITARKSDSPLSSIPGAMQHCDGEAGQHTQVIASPGLPPAPPAAPHQDQQSAGYSVPLTLYKISGFVILTLSSVQRNWNGFLSESMISITRAQRDGP